MGGGDADRAAPDGFVVEDEACQEVLVAAYRLAVFEMDADDFVAGALGAVPGAVEGDEGVAAVVWRERCGAGLGLWVERHLEWGGVGLNEDVGGGDLGGQVGAFVAVALVFVAADIVPGPTVEGAGTDPCYVVGRQVVAHFVALVGGAPDVAVDRLDGHADAVADAGREDGPVTAVRVEG